MELQNQKKLNRLIMLLCFLVEWIVIALIEIYGVLPIYYPEIFFQFHTDGLSMAALLLCAYAFITPTDLSKPSTWAYLLLVLSLGVPSTVVGWVMERNVIYTFIVFGFLSVVAGFLHIRVQAKTLKITNADQFLKILFWVYVAASLYLFAKRGGIDSRAFDFSDIYELRAEDNIKGLDGYLKNWCVKALFPFFFLYTFEKKQYFRTVLCLVLQMLLYLSFGEKTTLFSMVLVTGVYFVYTLRKPAILFLGFSVVVLIPLIVYLENGDYDWLSSLSRRFCHVPSAIGYNYYDFFSSGNPHLWLSETMIGRLFGIPSPYPRTFSYYISGGQGMANTGIVADAYANGGIYLCILFAIILGLVLLCYDNLVNKRKHAGVIVGILGYSCINLMDNGLLTSLLTNGMLLTLLLACMLPELEEDETTLKEKKQFRFPIRIVFRR